MSDTPVTQPRSGPVRAPKGPHVYFIRADDAIKIGFSEKVATRFAGLQSSHAVDLELLGTVPEPGFVERSYHERFAHLRIRGEWFRAEPELLAAIEEDCTNGIASFAAPAGPDYAEMYKVLKAEAKRDTSSQLGFARLQVLFRLKQLVINETLPDDIRVWHKGVHIDGLKEATAVLERMQVGH